MIGTVACVINRVRISYFTTDGLTPVHLGANPLEAHDQSFFLRLNPCGHSPYVTSSLTRGWVCLLWIGFAFVKYTYRTYNIGLHGSRKAVSPISEKIWNEEPLVGFEMPLRAEPHLYVSLAAAYWAHSAACKFHLLWLWAAYELCKVVVVPHSQMYVTPLHCVTKSAMNQWTEVHLKVVVLSRLVLNVTLNVFQPEGGVETFPWQ
jgi:hypothetical protein